MLRSTLDPALIERAALTNKRILEAEAADVPDDVDGAEHGVRTHGSIIAWNSADQLAALGILHVVLALILVSGKIITDSASPSLLFLPFPIPDLTLSHTVDLRMLLRRLRLRPPTQLALPAHSPHRTLTLDTYLLQLQRQGYLDRSRIGSAGGASGTSQKRGRGRTGGAMQQGNGGDEGDVAWEWRWGPRAMAEIGETAVAHFVAEFMAERASGGGGGGGGSSSSGGRTAAGGGGGDGEVSDDEAGGRGGKLAALLKGVECAAGGDLAGVTTWMTGDDNV